MSYGSDQSFTITPATGYYIADVQADGVSVGAVSSYTFTNVTADHTVAAFFAEVVPAVFNITLPPGTTVADYRIVSVPLMPANPDPTVFIGSQIGTYDTTVMRIASFDEDSQTFLEYPFSEFDNYAGPGDAAWFLFRNGKTLVINGNETPLTSGPLGENGYYKPITTGWNMIGNPFTFDISVNSILIQEGSTVVNLPQTDNNITQPVFWIWSGGEYVPATILPAGVGGWLLKFSSGDAQVFFPAVPATRSDDRFEPVDTKGLDRPPAPPGFFSGSAPTTANKGGGCFIQSIGGLTLIGSRIIGLVLIALFITAVAVIRRVH